MTTDNAAPQAAATPAPSTATPVAAPAATTPAPDGQKPPETPAATPAAPVKPPLDTKALVEKRRLEKRVAELEAANKEAAEAVAFIKRIKDPKERFAAAKEAGLTYEEYTNYVLADMGKKTPEAEPVALPPEVVEKLKLVDEIQAERQKTKETAEQEAARKAFAEKVDVVKKYVGERVESLPMISALGAHEAFLQAFLAETQANEGIPPDDEDFAARYEKQLADTVEKQLAAIAATSKGKALIQRLLAPPAEAAPEPTASPKQDGSPAPRNQPRSVTNALSTETSAPVDLSKLSDKELRKRAIAAMRSA